MKKGMGEEVLVKCWKTSVFWTVTLFMTLVPDATF
jgi:hypothetical protein